MGHFCYAMVSLFVMMVLSQASSLISRFAQTTSLEASPPVIVSLRLQQLVLCYQNYLLTFLEAAAVNVLLSNIFVYIS